MRFLTILLPAILLAAPAHAQTKAQASVDLRVMMCEFDDPGNSGWIAEFVMLTRQDSGPHAGRIEVFDPILQTLVGHPIAAVITADTSSSRSYGWALGRVKNQSGQFSDRLDYRLTVRKSDGAAKLDVVAAGYDNAMQGTGHCASPDK